MGLVYHIFLKLQYYMGYKSNYFVIISYSVVQRAENIRCVA